MPQGPIPNLIDVGVQTATLPECLVRLREQLLTEAIRVLFHA